MGGTHGATHKIRDARQIKTFLAELCLGPICCWTLLTANSGRDAGMARRTPRHLCLCSSLALQLWFYAKGRPIKLEIGAHFNLTKKSKREIVPISLLNVVLVYMKGFACFTL